MSSNFEETERDHRAAGRERPEKFLTPEQLTRFGAEVAKAEDFLSPASLHIRRCKNWRMKIEPSGIHLVLGCTRTLGW
jgi:hypothetical protein